MNYLFCVDVRYVPEVKNNFGAIAAHFVAYSRSGYVNYTDEDRTELSCFRVEHEKTGASAERAANDLVRAHAYTGWNTVQITPVDWPEDVLERWKEVDRYDAEKENDVKNELELHRRREQAVKQDLEARMLSWNVFGRKEEMLSSVSVDYDKVRVSRVASWDSALRRHHVHFNEQTFKVGDNMKVNWDRVRKAVEERALFFENAAQRNNNKKQLRSQAIQQAKQLGVDATFIVKEDGCFRVSATVEDGELFNELVVLHKKIVASREEKYKRAREMNSSLV